jgi:hypothetical protein
MLLLVSWSIVSGIILGIGMGLEMFTMIFLGLEENLNITFPLKIVSGPIKRYSEFFFWFAN